MIPTLSFGPLSLPVPELSLILGFWLGTAAADRFASKLGVSSKILSDVLLYSAAAGLVGARLSFLAAFPEAFRGNLLSIFSLNVNFLDPVGGFTIAAAAAAIYLSGKNISIWKALDAVSPFLAVMLIAHRFSLFSSGSYFGRQTTLPWGISLWNEIRHPVNLYLILGEVFILVLILRWAVNYSERPGTLFLVFTALSSLNWVIFSAYQAFPKLIVFGIRASQTAAWFVLVISLLLLNHKLSSPSEDPADEA